MRPLKNSLEDDSLSMNKTQKVFGKLFDEAFPFPIFGSFRKRLFMILHFLPKNEYEWIKCYLPLSIALIPFSGIFKRYSFKNKH